MRVLIDLLPATNLSARHVLLGHLTQLSRRAFGGHEYIVLFHKKNRDVQIDLGPAVKWIECPVYTSHWFARYVWEYTRMPALVKSLKIDLLFNISGGVLPFVKIPQITYAMNPLPLIRGINRSLMTRIKEALQRRSYRYAMKKAEIMLFLSEYMQKEFRLNAGFVERRSKVVYAGLDDDVYRDAEEYKENCTRDPFRIISVSVMTYHKNIETLLKAVHLIKKDRGIQPELFLAGPWASAEYRKKIDRILDILELRKGVVVAGQVSREDLHRLYASSKVFCLMSKCESFGIPAVEAQAFGTPVVSSNCCAIPEVCGEGGIYLDPDDAEGVAREIYRLLTDPVSWEKLSTAARDNASKYKWDDCAKSLMKILEPGKSFR
ncbi:MAG: glycosyltransferase family 1 protein [Candidatus Omnitrophota bacterium]|nr:glycosyltransferase family 1 protein [Candidatus Omnitrophota bacterium]